MVPNLLDEVLHKLPCLKLSLSKFGSREPETWPDWFKADNLYSIYQKFSNVIQPEKILEIGALNGFSLISLIDGSSAIKEVLWVDNESYMGGSNYCCLANLFWYLCKFRDGKPVKMGYFRSIDGLNGVFPGKYDLIHIDGDHSSEGKLRDLRIARYLEPKFIILDDYFKLDEVRRAICDWSKEQQKKYYIIDMFERGLTIFDMKNVGIKSLLTQSGIRVILEGTCL